MELEQLNSDPDIATAVEEFDRSIESVGVDQIADKHDHAADVVLLQVVPIEEVNPDGGFLADLVGFG